MNTKRVNAAAGVIHGSQKNGKQTATGIAADLEAARLLQSPETAAEQEQLSNDLAGACLARWEEEQDNARLRLAWESARRDRRALRARVAELEAAPTTVYRAEHPDSGITLGHYISITAAHQHCETLARREGNTGLVSWVPDDSDPWGPEELTFFDVEYCDGDDVPVQTCTGYVVTPLEVASEYDEEAAE